MNLDLTGLADIERPMAGEPLMVPLTMISCDSDQPRKYIDAPALHELAASIRAIGVVQPISVRPDPVADGRYIINYGERRLRASVIAGLSEIPAFIHRTPNSYTQVAENLHRAELSPMEIALFIQRRLDDGEMKQDVAAKLGYKKSYVTEHLALLESPACVEKAYANGVASARTLYDLRRLHDEFPRQVDDWIASGVEVTRDSIVAFGQKIRHDELARDLATVSGHLPLASQAATPSLPAPSLETNLSTATHVVQREETKTEVSSDLNLGERLSQQAVRHDELAGDLATVSGHLAAASQDATPALVTSALATDLSIAATVVPREAAKTDVSPDQDLGGTPSRHARHELTTRSTDVEQPGRKLRIKVHYRGRNAMIDEDSVVRIQYADGGVAEVRLADAAVLAVVAG